jgi:hypothetical protein
VGGGQAEVDLGGGEHQGGRRRKAMADTNQPQWLEDG